MNLRASGAFRVLLCALCHCWLAQQCSPAAEGAIFVSAKGTDGAAGARETPLKTIRAALKMAAPGATITVLEGTYREALTFTKSGDEGKPISLVAEGHAIIDVSANKEDRLAVVGRGVGYLVIEGLDITGHEQGLKFKNCHDIVVRRCRAHHGKVGLSLEGSNAAKMLFEEVELADNEAGGLDVANGVAMEDVTFRRCSAHDNACKDGNDGFGISHKCTTKNVRFEYCTAYNNGSDGFDISGRKGFGVTLLGCVSHHNGTKMWGTNFKCWNPGSTFINCVAYVTGKDADGNFEAHADDITFLNCTSGENGDCGIRARGRNTKLINCLFTAARKMALRLVKDKDNQQASLTAENCLVSGCKPGDVAIGKDGNLEGDALFVDSAKGDYRIKPGSAAAGKGKELPEVTVDAAGQPRPKGATAIGAYEPAKQ
ncbi:MAG: right-handed parallel beta-helix repeat-containing protein [Planctomycetota bacterium]|nr:right-handed parallel beta-helix repeat-containing protein [Planctomycetota bacterium]